LYLNPFYSLLLAHLFNVHDGSRLRGENVKAGKEETKQAGLGALISDFTTFRMFLVEMFILLSSKVSTAKF
jgi:hypothetical protein